MRILRNRLRPRRRKSTIFLLVLVASAFTAIALASHGDVSLTDSNFEIDSDANLKVDHADPPSLDWANVTETLKKDKDSGADDDSFGQGSKEDTPVPTVVDGSIPPNKSDLLNFGVYLETNADGRFLNVFWHRVQEPSGTTNMDFEFNKSETLSANGVTPVRSPGDILIQYDLSQGGTNPILSVSRWITGSNSETKADCEASNSLPCWSEKANLSATGDATGSINTTSIPSEQSEGLGTVSPRTFGEATIDFDAISGDDGCDAFGSAYLKSRSSDSFTAAMKDFIAPTAVDLSNCGSIKIKKVDDDDPANPLAGAVFTLYNDNAPIGGTRGDEDTATDQTCTTDDTGFCTIEEVLEGEYWVVETTTPEGHDTAADQHATIVADEQVELTFVDPRHTGAIEVTKTRKHAADGAGDHPHSGVDFTVNGVTKATDANGKACFDGLLLGNYTVSETTPAGYEGEADKTVTVDNKASCADDPYVGESVAFSNIPLSDITVSFSSQVPGGTAATIQCEDLTAKPPDTTPNAFDDTSETFEDLKPGTYDCEVVVDP